MAKAACALLGALMGAMAVFPMEALSAARDAAGLFMQKVFPALFPILACMLLFTSRLAPKPLLCALLGLVSGSPGGAKLCAPLPVSANKKRRLAALTGTLSPMFLLSSVPQVMGFPSGVKIYLCHVAGACLTALLLPGDRQKTPVNASRAPVPLSLSEALLGAFSAMAVAGGSITLCAVAARMLFLSLPMLPGSAMTICQLFLEITGGLQALSQSALPCKMLLTVLFTSLGGACILMQNAAFWQKGGVGMGRLLRYRIIHAILSGAVYLLFFGI